MTARAVAARLGAVEVVGLHAVDLPGVYHLATFLEHGDRLVGRPGPPAAGRALAFVQVQQMGRVVFVCIEGAVVDVDHLAYQHLGLEAEAVVMDG